ncbi:hypothetical protein GEMRC1_010479 [Eukaryota sp. GEM-RC1]
MADLIRKVISFFFIDPLTTLSIECLALGLFNVRLSFPVKTTILMLVPVVGFALVFWYILKKPTIKNLSPIDRKVFIFKWLLFLISVIQPDFASRSGSSLRKVLGPDTLDEPSYTAIELVRVDVSIRFDTPSYVLFRMIMFGCLIVASLLPVILGITAHILRKRKSPLFESFNSLTCGYKQQFFFWEFLEMSRRTLLLVFYVTLPFELAVVLTSLLSFICLQAHLLLQPFKESNLQAFQTVSLTLVFLGEFLRVSSFVPIIADNTTFFSL